MIYELQMTGDLQALALARAMTLRPDMRTDFDAEGATLPAGPIWALYEGPRLAGLGGLERRGAGASKGWLLIPEGLTPRDWAMGRRAIRQVLEWAACHGVKRVAATVESANLPACRLLVRLGFEASWREGDDITMTRELV